jgi:hypothetical protein
MGYIVFIAEHANLERRPFPDVITEGFPDPLLQAFQYTIVPVGLYLTYQTESMPSWSGTLEVYFEDGDRYVGFGLTPYNSRDPFTGQDRHAEQFAAMLQSVSLTP